MNDRIKINKYVAHYLLSLFILVIILIIINIKLFIPYWLSYIFVFLSLCLSLYVLLQDILKMGGVNASYKIFIHDSLLLSIISLCAAFLSMVSKNNNPIIKLYIKEEIFIITFYLGIIASFVSSILFVDDKIKSNKHSFIYVSLLFASIIIGADLVFLLKGGFLDLIGAIINLLTNKIIFVF